MICSLQLFHLQTLVQHYKCKRELTSRRIAPYDYLQPLVQLLDRSVVLQVLYSGQLRKFINIFNKNIGITITYVIGMARSYYDKWAKRCCMLKRE